MAVWTQDWYYLRCRDADMGRRMWPYNANMDLMENTPGYSVLVYLLKDNDEKSKQWLQERFDNVLNIFEESWTYQEALQKGREEERQRSIQAASKQQSVSLQGASLNSSNLQKRSSP